LSSHENGRLSTAVQADFGSAWRLFAGRNTVLMGRLPLGLRPQTAGSAMSGCSKTPGNGSVRYGKPGFHFGGKCSKTCAATVNRCGSYVLKDIRPSLSDTNGARRLRLFLLQTVRRYWGVAKW
jgi:hypothetical protein